MYCFMWGRVTGPGRGAEKLVCREQSPESESSGKESPTVRPSMNHCLHLERERWEVNGVHTEQDERRLPYCLPHLSIPLVAVQETEPSTWP